MTTAILVVDVQNDFTEGGALGVDGGSAVAQAITRYLRPHPDTLVVASRDWHNPDDSNGGHFSAAPDFVDTWPVHCVAGTTGADYHPDLDTSLIGIHVTKGQGIPAYSMFEGVTEDGRPLVEVLHERGITGIEVVGIATDHCVRATATDAIEAGFAVRILSDLVAGVSPERSAQALAELAESGAEVRRSDLR
ncbi:MAG: isochorismatase family protein [Mycetocola sp.]